jgi:hypothetical protein
VPKITECPQPYRDDLAAQRVAIFGYDPSVKIHAPSVHIGGALRDFAAAVRVGMAKAERFQTLRLTQMQFEALLNHRKRTLGGYGYPELPCTMEEAKCLGFLDDGEIAIPSWLQGPIRESDRPGITALAAKNAKPAPEPVLSIGGSEFDTAELLEALQIVRARKSAPVKETPRGLMVVRDFDHRLGLWNGEV